MINIMECINCKEEFLLGQDCGCGNRHPRMTGRKAERPVVCEEMKSYRERLNEVNQDFFYRSH